MLDDIFEKMLVAMLKTHFLHTFASPYMIAEKLRSCFTGFYSVKTYVDESGNIRADLYTYGPIDEKSVLLASIFFEMKPAMSKTTSTSIVNDIWVSDMREPYDGENEHVGFTEDDSLSNLND